jgi:hypothetical protein
LKDRHGFESLADARIDRGVLAAGFHDDHDVALVAAFADLDAAETGEVEQRGCFVDEAGLDGQGDLVPVLRRIRDGEAPGAGGAGRKLAGSALSPIP